LEGELGLKVRGANLLEKAVPKNASHRAADSTYTVPFGKSNPVRDHFHELSFDVERSAGPVRKIKVFFRAYDDGVAFRYVIPQQPGLESIEVTDEPTTFHLTANPQTW